jgi:2-polyprenyl-6-methoxyphenol hydroxylase-like FAD-dependent oxidoreductase
MTNRAEPGPPPGEPGSVAATGRRLPLKEMRHMRIAIVGAGLAGLATAAAFTRAGHDVTVFEQADGLRASGLAINLWSNATSLLPAFGIPADRIPGEPFSRMVWRASGGPALRRITRPVVTVS